MSQLELTVRLGVGLLLVLSNAFFVASEFALTRTPQFSERDFSGHKSLRLGWRMTQKLEIYLTACQLGISTTSVLLGVIAEPAMTAIIRPGAALLGLSGGALHGTSIVISIVIINLIHKIWGEQAPTYLGVESPIQVARYTSRPLYLWTRMTYPIVIVGDSLAKWTLKLVGVEVTRSWARKDAGGDGEQEPEDPRSALIHALLRARFDRKRRKQVLATYELGNVPVGAIAVPRHQVQAVRVDLPWTENRQRIAEYRKTRLPILESDSLDDAVGAIYTPALFRHLADLDAGSVPLSDLACELVEVSEDTSVADLIAILQRASQELALVRSAADGRAVGIVTITDALEAITGDVEDPMDVEDAEKQAS